MALNYERIGWENAPSTNTPIDAGSLNHMDNGILAVSNQYDVDVPYLQQQVAGIPSTVNAAMEAKYGESIADDVSSWLTEHVDPAGSAVVVDDTLTISGAAADAKVTGDLRDAFRINCQDIDIGSFIKNSYVDTSGQIQSGNGNFKRTDYIDVSSYVGKQLLFYTMAYTGQFCISFFDTNKTYIPNSGIAGDGSASGVNVKGKFDYATVPQSAKYLIISVYTTTEPENYVFCNYNDYREKTDSANNDINVLETTVSGHTYNHSATVTSGSSNYYTFPKPIKQGTNVTFVNNSTTTNFTVNLINRQNVETSVGTVVAGGSLSYTLLEDAYKMRSYCGGTDWSFTIFAGVNTSIEHTIENDKMNTTFVFKQNDMENMFLIDEAMQESATNGIKFKRVNKFAFTLDGQATANTNILFAFGTFPVAGTMLCALDGIHSGNDMWIQTGYFDSSSQAHNLSIIIEPGEKKEINFPSAARTGRFYIHIDDDASFSNTLFKVYLRNKTQIDEDQVETIVDELMKNSFNSTFHTGLTDFKTPAEKFSELMAGDTVNNVPAVKDCEAFLFFTDPHTEANVYDVHFEEYMGQIQKMYHSTPTSFVISGGDWLGNSDTPEQASYKMGLVGATCRSMLDPCYMLVGNHDTNYQGKKDSGSQTYTTRFPNDSIRNLWYKGKKAYFTFDGSHTRFYCFDTGTEDQTLSGFNNYGYEQAEWFASALLTETNEHIAIAMHIYYSSGTTWNEISHLIMQIAAAYNTRSSITVNGNSYDYSVIVDEPGEKKLVEFAVCGHLHNDAEYRFTEDGADIPVILTVDTGYHSTYPTDASFDLMFVDYDNRQIKTVRVGTGEDRTVNLASLT